MARLRDKRRIIKDEDNSEKRGRRTNIIPQKKAEEYDY